MTEKVFFQSVVKQMLKAYSFSSLSLSYRFFYLLKALSMLKNILFKA